ncbi:MAG: penicillin-binding protein 2 [Chlamydiales bacterium]|nr:penicillin-binding protein 2 [Chlamydiales bacterium]
MNLRLAGLATFVFSLFSLLILQFYKIQVIEGEKWKTKALAQHRFAVSIPAKRGLFFATVAKKPNCYKPLVVDMPKYHVYIDPDNIPVTLKGAMAREVNAYLNKDMHFISEQFNKKSRSRRIASWVSRDEMVEIEGWWKGFARQNKLASNALFFIQDWQRSYPYGALLGQVLHTVRESKEPTGGLELTYNRVLEGKNGKRMLMRSPRHSLELDQVAQEPRDGADIYLTIDPTCQAICEQEIAKAVESVKAKGGWAIMLDPKSGEVMALAQYPFFEPKHFNRYYNDPELIEHTKVKAISDCFEPGSTMKPITIAIALLANEELIKRGEKPVFDPEEKIRCDDGRVPGTSHRIRDVSNHKFLNMKLALIKSSNVYMGKLTERIINRLGEKWYRDQLANVFGFGSKTNIELPSEAVGMLPMPGKTYSGGQLQWSKPTPYTLAIGYNMLATSMQMTRAYAIIANGGHAVEPTLVKRICQKDKELYHIDERSTLKRRLPLALTHQLIDAMKLVTKPGGSGARADVRGYTEAGKSGTSEKIVDGAYSKKVHFASFLGFAPAHDARFVLFVGIDEPEYRFIPGYGKTHYGGKCAAPAFCEIARRTLNYLGVPQDDPHGYPLGDPRYDPEKADSLVEVKELKALYELWNQS